MRVIFQLILVMLLFAGLLRAEQLSEHETVARCRQELSAAQPVEVRRRAALIVGKYTSKEATAALISALDDPDAEVRRNALVSIGEENAHLRQAGMAVLQRLTDDDVTVRRLASSIIPQCLGVFISGNAIISPNVRITAGARKRDAHEAEETQRLLNAALNDEDEAVRRNALFGVRYFPGRFEHAALENFLDSSETEIWSLALNLYATRSDATEEAIRAQLEARLAKCADDVAQRKIILTIANAAPVGIAEPILRKLMQDESPQLRAEAVNALCLRCGDIDESLKTRLLKIVRDNTIDDSARANAVGHLANCAIDEVRAFALDDSLPGAVRQSAWLRLRRENIAQEVLVERLGKESYMPCRRILLNMLRRYVPTLTPEQWQQLQSSPYDDVRKATLEMALGMEFDEDRRVEMAREALLDESKQVRKLAIQGIGRLKPDGWLDDMLATLEDPDDELAETAVVYLTAPIALRDKRVRPALKQYLPRCKNELLKNRIQRKLSN